MRAPIKVEVRDGIKKEALAVPFPKNRQRVKLKRTGLPHLLTQMDPCELSHVHSSAI